MKKEKNIFCEAPLGLHLGIIAKQYVGVVSKKLSHLEIDRYYYTVVVINRLGGSVTQQQLADILRTDKVTMVRIIDYLSKKGFVKRKRNKSDRREYFIELTDKAAKSLPDIKNALKEANDSTFKDISEQEIERFYKILEKIIFNLSALQADKVDLNFRRRKK
jgi:MarR family transcriptional regulator, transcriptional regulator for hemolysin